MISIITTRDRNNDIIVIENLFFETTTRNNALVLTAFNELVSNKLYDYSIGYMVGTAVSRISIMNDEDGAFFLAKKAIKKFCDISEEEYARYAARYFYSVLMKRSPGSDLKERVENFSIEKIARGDPEKINQLKETFRHIRFLDSRLRT